MEGAAVAEVQGYVAGLTAAYFLSLVAKADFDKDLSLYQEALMKARKDTIPFYPHITTGRDAMARIWKNI